MQIVLVGQTGSGKTSLFNKITNSNQKVLAGGCSVTENVQQKLSAYGKFQFNVVDTPGLGTDYCKMDSAAGLIVALTGGPVNRIIITIKAGRVDTMKVDYQKVLKSVQNYLHLVTIAVTHKDQIMDLEFKDQIKQVFSKMNCNSIIFTSQKHSGRELCEKILKLLINSRAEQINFTPETIFYSFDFDLNHEDSEIEVWNMKGDLEIQFRNISNIFQKELRNQSTETFQGISKICILLKGFIDKARELLENFEIRNFSFLMDLNQQDLFIAHQLFKKCLEKDLQYLLSNVKIQFQNNKQAEAEYQKVIGSENIDCSFEKNKEWKIQLQQSQELCLKQLQNKMEEQKKRILTL